MATRKKKNNTDEKKRKLLGILLILFSVLLFISLATHSGWDDRRITSHDNPLSVDYRNQVGAVGALSSYLFFFFFGWLSFFMVLLPVIAGLYYLNAEWRLKITPGFWFTFSVCTLVTMMTNVYLIHHSTSVINHTETNGGYVIYYLTLFIMKIIGATGSFVLLGAGIIAWLIILGHKYNTCC